MDNREKESVSESRIEQNRDRNRSGRVADVHSSLKYNAFVFFMHRYVPP